MYRLTVKELKEIQLTILKKVAGFCDKQGLRYYLCGGTLLGAVRHNGFIPWDDDIDIAMPRKDYENFLSTFNSSNQRYAAYGIENKDDWHTVSAKVVDKNTILYDKLLKSKYRKQNVFIDVFPLDGIPDNCKEEHHFLLQQKLLGIIANASAFRFYRSRHYSDSKESNTSLRNFSRTVLKCLAILLLSGFNTQKIIKKINKNARKYSFGKTKDIGITVCIWSSDFEKSSYKSFSERQKFKFEDAEFWGPKGYDEYLTRTYGDYMMPPPEKNRVVHHSFEAYLTENEDKN